MKGSVYWFVLLCVELVVTGRAAEQSLSFFDFTSADTEQVEVWVDVDSQATRPISRLLYGKFAEHLGRNIYLGMWAQTLVNAGFEPASLWGRRAGQIGRELAWRLETPKLADAVARGLPPGWLADYKGRGSCTADTNARAGRQCVRLEAADESSVVRLWQPVFLPLHRQSTYQWSMWARSSRKTQLKLRLSWRADQKVAAEVPVLVSSSSWKKYVGSLQLPACRPAHDAPFHWEIAVTGPATVWIDQCFLYPADHIDGWDPDVVRMTKESGLPLLRWPGGNFASGYHWKDGIGPIDDRPVRLNRPWNQPEPNYVGTDEFMRFCELVGAEPLICVNAGDGSAQEAADWVEYCNGSTDTPLGQQRAKNGHPKPYGVRYWEVGNELYGSWQIGHCSADEYAERYRRFADAMRRRDPSVRLIANGHNRQWNGILIQRCADILQRVSLHTLIGGGMPRQTDPTAVWRSVVGFPTAYSGQLQALVKQLRERVPDGTIAVTELQIFTNRSNLPNNSSLAEALFWAGVVHTAMRMRGGVELITHSALVNHGGGLRKVRQVVYANPVYWARRMYSTQAGRWLLPVHLRGPSYSVPRLHNLPALQDAPVVDVVALLHDNAKALSLLAINRDQQKARSTTFHFDRFPAASTARWQWLTGPDILAKNTLEQPNHVRPQQTEVPVDGHSLKVVLPARSVSVLIVPTREGGFRSL